METVIDINKVSKVYKLYNKPIDRVKETFSIKRRTYGKSFYALDDVSFSINKGETIGIIGRNGSGKSTILKILTGVLNQTQGTVNVNGKISALLELGAGFNMEYNGIENIYLNATIMKVPREEIEKKIPEILAFADIGEHIYQPVKTYSSGMFVRLAFAVAINVNPDILIVDEALAVGDTRFQLKCMDKFVEFMEAGKTVLFVSHDINMIKRFCKRAIWLNEGKLIMDGETDEVTDRYIDFLKSEKNITEYLANLDNNQEIEQQYNMQNVDIAEVVKVEFVDNLGNSLKEIAHGNKANVRIGYYVAEEHVDNAVLGVAIRSIDNEYICGINTLLDKKKIPWKIGYNEVCLQYKNMNLTGGGYYLDVAIFDSTATVPIDYKSRVLDFIVSMDYIAEGIVVLEHEWR